MPQVRGANRTDFSGGINAIASPWHLSNNEVLRAENLILDEIGSLNVRDGLTTIDMAPDTITSILTLNTFTKVNGVEVPLAVVRDQFSNQLLYNRSTTPWSLLGTFGTLYDLPRIVPWLNVGIVAAGYEVPWYTDGTTFTQFSGGTIIPGAKDLVVHQNALWAWNTAATTSTYDGPSSLRQSDVENFNNWPTANQLFLSKDDGQGGTGLAVFTVAEAGITPSDFLVAFKRYAGYLVAGSFGGGSAPTFTRIKSNMGCVARRSVQFCTGNGFQGIIRLTHRGFALFNGINDEVISDKIRPYIFGHDDLLGLTWDQIDKSVATQVQNPPLYLCACPVVPSGTLTRIFVYDLLARAWTICTFPFPFATINMTLSNTAQPMILAGQSNGGRVMQLFNGADTDDGAPISWSLQLPPFGVPLQRFYIRRLLLKLYHIAAHQHIVGQFVGGPSANRRSLTKTSVVSVGANALPGSPFRAMAEVSANFDIGLTADSLYTQLSGAGMLGIRALSYHVEPKPLMRPVRM